MEFNIQTIDQLLEFDETTSPKTLDQTYHQYLNVAEKILELIEVINIKKAKAKKLLSQSLINYYTRDDKEIDLDMFIEAITDLPKNTKYAVILKILDIPGEIV